MDEYVEEEEHQSQLLRREYDDEEDALKKRFNPSAEIVNASFVVVWADLK